MNSTDNIYVKELYLMASKIDADTVTISNEVLKLPEFSLWSACSHKKGHHYGDGGLARHTCEVADLCSLNGYRSNSFGNTLINHKVLFLSALFHDVGKIWDYKYDSSIVVGEYPLTENEVGWTGTPHKRTIHHITKSAIFWSKAVEKSGLCKDIEDDVLHCILAHHGQREFGSPVAPLSREAWILHLCDSLSARTNDCDRIDLLNLRKY